jgi:hypothetical protein
VLDPAALSPSPYQPSVLVGDSRHWTALISPDAVGDISAYYTAALSRLGWELLTSTVVTTLGATLVARLGAHGITISIRATGCGTAVTIARY